MQRVLSFFESHWAWIGGIAGVCAATALFVRDVLTIAKLRREIARLKQEDMQRQQLEDSRVYRPSDREVARFAEMKVSMEMLRGSHWAYRRRMLSTPAASWLSAILIIAAIVLIFSLPFALPDWIRSLVWRVVAAGMLGGLVYWLLRFPLRRRLAQSKKAWQQLRD